MIKLHFGCAEKRLPGYINIDVRSTAATDMVCDAWDCSEIADGSVSEIYSRHMLEHLDPDDARKTLRRWHALLVPGGILRLIVPDITFHARQLLGLVESHLPDQLQHAFAGFWGWRDESRGGSRHDAHRWGYTWETLNRELADCGFAPVVRVTEGTDGEAWHLHVIATRPDQREAPDALR